MCLPCRWQIRGRECLWEASSDTLLRTGGECAAGSAEPEVSEHWLSLSCLPGPFPCSPGAPSRVGLLSPFSLTLRNWRPREVESLKAAQP